MFGYIYKITNNINKLMYIGKHAYDLPELDSYYITSGKIITSAINKHGIDNFSIELIDVADTLEELNSKEIYWISYYNTYLGEGYNLTKGGDGGNTVYNKCKITDGVNEKWYPKDSPLPEGWRYGSKLCGVNHPLFGRIFVWLTNNIVEVQVNINDVETLSNYIKLGFIINKRLPMTDAQKSKLSVSKTGIPMNELAHQKMIGHWEGDKNPNVINPKFGINNPFYGKHHTDEAKLNNSLKHKIKYKCPFCNYISNHGSVTKHINKYHISQLIESASTIESLVYEKYIDE